MVIGLTGPVAAGKSTVAAFLKARGAAIIDADEVYRELLVPGSDLWDRVVARFGPEVVDAEGRINRPALARIVFRDPAALADLERIAHPPVIAEIRRRIASAGDDVVVVEAVKLIESGMSSDVDVVWLVTADPHIRQARLAAHRGLSAEEARARIAASHGVAGAYSPFAVIIDNSGDMSSLERAVAAAWDAALAEAADRGSRRSASTGERA